MTRELQSHARPFLNLLGTMSEEGERAGVFRPMRSDSLHFISTIAGSTLFYVAAIATFVGELPYDLLSEE